MFLFASGNPSATGGVTDNIARGSHEVYSASYFERAYRLQVLQLCVVITAEELGKFLDAHEGRLWKIRSDEFAGAQDVGKVWGKHSLLRSRAEHYTQRRRDAKTTSARLSVAVDRSAGQQPFIAERAVFLIYPKLVRIAIVGDIDVHPPVAVEVGRYYSQSVAKFFRDACTNGHIFKRSVTLVMKEPIARGSKHARCAIVPGAGTGVTVGTVGRIKVSVVHQHQIQPTIPVVINESSAGAPARIISAGFFRDINKRPVTFVQIHLV